ncbi:hypothetical protein ACLKA6_010610 [Drosophila palustris]
MMTEDNNDDDGNVLVLVHRVAPSTPRTSLLPRAAPASLDGEVVSTVIQEQEADSIDSSLMAWLLDAA